MENNTILKNLCTVIYLICCGEYWYEKRNTMTFAKSLPNKIFWWTIYAGFIALFISEALSAFFGEYSRDQKSDILSHVLPQTMVIAKMGIFFKNGDLARKLIYDISNVCRDHEKDSTLKMQNRKIKFFVYLNSSTVTSVLIYMNTMAIIGALHGLPFITLASYWPKATDDSLLASTIRALIPIPWIFTMIPMMATDLLVVAHLIMLAYKFQTLRLYFNSIRDDIDILEENGSYTSHNIETFRQRLLDGIMMHRELLRLAHCIRDAFGTMMSLQVCQSFMALVFLLMRFAFTTDTSLKLQTAAYVFTMLVMLAQYLWSAGDVTYEASLLPDAIFHCGWHVFLYNDRASADLTSPLRDIRTLILLGCVHAQRMLVFKAFRVQNLSYDTFVSVVKATYSTFAVFARR